MAAAFIEPDSGRVLKVLSDGSVVIQQGWNKHIHISGDTITVPPLTKVVAVSKTADVTKTDHASNMPAASEQGQHSHEDAPDALRHHDRHGSSQHVPELPPRAHSAPPRVSRAPCVAADPKHTGVHNGECLGALQQRNSVSGTPCLAFDRYLPSQQFVCRNNRQSRRCQGVRLDIR